MSTKLTITVADRFLGNIINELRLTLGVEAISVELDEIVETQPVKPRRSEVIESIMDYDRERRERRLQAARYKREVWEREYDDVMTVACTYCEAPAGQPCVLPSGKPLSRPQHHGPRRRDFDKMQATVAEKVKVTSLPEDGDEYIPFS